jgi:hypothetical protein
MDVTKMALDGVDWIHLAQGIAQLRVVLNTVMEVRAA